MPDEEPEISDQAGEGFAYPEHQAMAEDLEGASAIFRIGFRSMFIEGMPEQFAFAGAVIRHSLDPVVTNRTLILQQPGLSLTWVKEREDSVEIAGGLPKVVFHLPFTVSSNLVIDFGRMRDRALSSVGLLAAVLDERVALDELFQDVVLLDPATDEQAGIVDAGLQVRSFLPRVVDDTELSALSAHPESSSFAPEIAVAARWYLKAAQAAPGPDAIVFFWIALEGLVPAEGKKVVKAVEKALETAGFSPSGLPVSVGKLYGLRADIVHKGKEDTDRIRAAYYILEQVTRLLIRDKGNLESEWPAAAGDNTWAEPTKSLIDRLRMRPRTFWHRR